jgi:hypothetical protein
MKYLHTNVCIINLISHKNLRVLLVNISLFLEPMDFNHA